MKMLLVRPFLERRTYRELLYLLTALPLSALWFGLLLAGWLAAGLTAVTPLLIPVLVGFRTATWLVAIGEASLARTLLGVEVEVPPTRFGEKGYWGRIHGMLSDTRFWQQQSFGFLRMLVGGTLGVAIVSAIGGAGWFLTLPITYRWSDTSYGSWHVDTLGRASLFIPAGIAAFVLSVWLVRAFAAPWPTLARLFLGGDGSAPAPAPTPRAEREPVPDIPTALRRALPVHAGVYVGLGVLVTVIWAITTRAYFWPEWVVLPLGLVLAIHAWVTLLQYLPDDQQLFPTRALGIDVGVCAALAGFLTCIWAVTTAGYFWPVWPMLALGIVVAGHVLTVLATDGSRAALAKRVEVLTTTRAGAVDASESELRRIERDLHDGAQARLVALGMSLGLAEQKLGSDPEAARQLLAEARSGAGEALRELRDLARGIHPPVLADRGLAAALAALAARTPLPVDVSVEAGERPNAAVETAAYFVAAEALANAAKHAGASHIEIRIARDGDLLTVEIVDDGRGGAEPAGPGLSGIRRRVEALDGTLEITSPPGGPTTVKAVLPCAS